MLILFQKYALQGVRGLLEFESSWPDLNDKIVDKCLHLLLSASQPNILRPATAIIHKLVMASPESRRLQVQLTGKGKAKETDPIEEDTQEKPSSLLLGFEKVFARIQAMGFAEQGSGSGGAPGFLKVITKRLEGTGDLELVAQRCATELLGSIVLTWHQPWSHQCLFTFWTARE